MDRHYLKKKKKKIFLRQQQRLKFFSFQIQGGTQLLQLVPSDLNTYYSDQESDNVLCLSLKKALIKTVLK